VEESKLMSLTVKELRVEAERLGVKRSSAMKKAELVEAILEASAKASCEAAAVVVDSESGADGEALSMTEAACSVVESKSKASAKPKLKAGGFVVEVEADADEVEAEAETETDEAAGDVTDAEAEAEVIEVREPDSVYIDRGAVLPEYIPGTCLYALVRDPETLFVYWNSNFESENGWLLTAYDAAGQVLDSFWTPARRNGRGYFRLPTISVSRVALSLMHGDGALELKLESHVRLGEQSRHRLSEKWVDVKTGSVVSEAPAPGQAPEYSQSFSEIAHGGGGGGAFGAVGPKGVACAPSSWFGSEHAPGSSDLLTGSSELNLRRK